MNFLFSISILTGLAVYVLFFFSQDVSINLFWKQAEYQLPTNEVMLVGMILRLPSWSSDQNEFWEQDTESLRRRSLKKRTLGSSSYWRNLSITLWTKLQNSPQRLLSRGSRQGKPAGGRCASRWMTQSEANSQLRSELYLWHLPPLVRWCTSL